MHRTSDCKPSVRALILLGGFVVGGLLDAVVYRAIYGREAAAAEARDDRPSWLAACFEPILKSLLDGCYRRVH